MRTIIDVLRLKHECGLSYRQIAGSLKISVGTVANYLSAAEQAGLSWPVPDDWDETSLAQIFAPVPPSSLQPEAAFAAVDFAWVHRELKRKGVTRQLLWEEYCQTHSSRRCYGYTQFCVTYREWRGKMSLSMRQTHRAGEKLFVDYCGPTVEVGPVGNTRPAQIFVAVLGASNYTYVEATWTQGLEDWLASHVATFNFFQGVPELVVPDNLKSGVARACRYEPSLNSSYAEMLAHYGTTALPARPYKPRDKAKVEAAVLLVERWIMARLRHRSFLTLAELNQAIGLLLQDLNARPFKKLEGSRQSQFAALDQPALKPLPLVAYEYAEWKLVRVHLDYHVEVHGHYYSVPHALVKCQLDARITLHTVELFQRGRRVASHPRSYQSGDYSTTIAHMPRAHQAHRQWSPAALLQWAARIGPNTHHVVNHLLTHKPHPEQGYRSCLGILNLHKLYGPQRLEAACGRALNLGSPTRHSIDAILKSGLDRAEVAPDQHQLPLPAKHENLRGAGYYK
ncbi:IS21-like element ISPsy14 family transposase [soil metagenome]